MSVKYLLFSAIIACTSCATSQQATEEPNSEPNSDVSKFAILVGDWEGDGWIYAGREKKEFYQTESVRPKFDGSVYIVEGLGLSKDDDKKVVHDTYGILSHNAEMSSLTMLYFSQHQGRNEVPIEWIEDRIWRWGFEVQGRQIRFTVDLSEKGLWKEVGEVSMDEGANWMQFFEMNLVRQR